MARSSLPPGMTIELARDMKLVGIIDRQIREVDAARVAEADDDHRLVRRRDPARDERIGRVDRRHALEVDVRLGELRADEVHVVGHARQDRVDGFVVRVAARRLVANELLDPFEVDHRHDADLEVGVRGDVHLRRHHRAVQALVEQQVGAARQILPRGEGADRSAVLLRFMLVVNVVARAPAAALAVAAEHFLELGQQVRLLAEMAEVVVAAAGAPRRSPAPSRRGRSDGRRRPR